MGHMDEVWQCQQEQENLSGMDDYLEWIASQEHEELLKKTAHRVSDANRIASPIDAYTKPF